MHPASSYSGQGFTYATADTVVARDDVLIVAGRITDFERLTSLT